MENINFRGIPTSLFLNGPKLGIVTDPQSVSDSIGVATFTGIATATFPDTNFSLDGGSIAFKWYFDGSLISDDEGANTATNNAAIVGFSSATGTGSTITINGLTSDDDGKEIYFEADYVPSAYQTTPPRTAGTARSTGNAFNEPLRSGIGTVTILPIIDITSQPTGQLVSIEDDATYTIAAQKTPGGDAVNYQWQLNGNDLSDGTTTTTVNETSTGKITFVAIHPDTQEVQAGATIDFSKVSSYDFGAEGFGEQDLRLTADADITVKLYLEGAGGGTSKRRSVQGGAGGKAEGTFTFLKDQNYMLRIGGNGGGMSLRHRTGGGNGSGNGSHGGGGGYTGLFIGSSTPDYTQENVIIMAGGGGGGSNDPATGGVGGGDRGAAGSNAPGRGGGAGTQSEGGAGGGNGGDGSALQGGHGGGADAALGGGSSSTTDNESGGAGGGGGYFGGGGGQTHNGCCADGAGGGGSGYVHPTLITGELLSQGEGTVPEGVNGSFRIEIASTTKEISTTITGSSTDTLTINAGAAANGTIRCKCTATGVQESPVFSNTVSYVVVDPRSLLEIETYNYADATATLSEFDLADGDLTIDYSSYTGNAVCFYAGDKNIDVEMEMYGGVGIELSGIPGEGGYSRIRFTMERDEEYILTGLFDAVDAPFLYRKGSLIAVVGGGGASSSGQKGGDGGGINVAGEDGDGQGGSSGGSGGPLFEAGTLPSNGIFGDRNNLTAVTPDTKRTDLVNGEYLGGRTLPCPRGVYWRDQGKTPCEDLGNIKFRTPDGTEISNTAEIARGYKSGYNIIQTSSGNLGTKTVQSGSGATGGASGQNNQAGGGGSGYTDGSVTVIDTQLGGSTGPAKVIIRIADPDTIDPSTTLQNVTFTVTRSAAYSNTIIFVKESGEGPDRITFGPNSGTVVVRAGFGAVYTRESVLINGAPGGKVRLTDNTLELEDAGDDDYNDLTVTPDKGRFTSDSRYEFTRATETVTFTQSRTSNENLGFTMTIVSGTGDGPQTIRFGSRPGFSGTLPSTVTAKIQQGTAYTITETNGVDRTTLSDDGILTVSDLDSNPGSLSVTPDKGEWTSTSRYEFT